MARTYRRDSRGRFARTGGGRKGPVKDVARSRRLSEENRARSTAAAKKKASAQVAKSAREQRKIKRRNVKNTRNTIVYGKKGNRSTAQKINVGFRNYRRAVGAVAVVALAASARNGIDNANFKRSVLNHPSFYSAKTSANMMKGVKIKGGAYQTTTAKRPRRGYR